MDIKHLIEKAHEQACKSGFYDCPECCVKGGVMYEDEKSREQQFNPNCVCGSTGKDPNKNIGELLMLIVSELGEALEAHRRGKFADWENYEEWPKDTFCIKSLFENHIKDTFEDEIADVFIRLFDLCGYLEIDIEKHIESKMKYNKTRPYKHNKEY